MQAGPGIDVARSTVLLTRSITATWWYTLTGVLFLDTVLVLVWTSSQLPAGPAAVAAVGLGGLVWLAAQVPLLLGYRLRSGSSTPLLSAGSLVPLAIAVGYGALAAVVTGSWVMAAFPVVQVLVLLDWGPGLRVRIVIAATAVLAALWIIDLRLGAIRTDHEGALLLGFYSTALPAMTVLSLWWWDVLAMLDRARASEARLGATQERLRVATDVHDLQGHHLQVIALQLELAERLMAADPEAALAQLRAARTSVDEARQGTRDLATRFRSVPLGDELANAVDLLRAAGVSAEASVHPSADLAPAAVLGPVVRETTTNVLRHGGGHWARLSLQPAEASWRFDIENDPESEAPADDSGGAGLEGVARRVAEAGGTLEVDRGRQAFRVTVIVPAGLEP
ncbi:two-component system, NarL family, sensor histidine kinase DesK [Rathayibacter oskolensis]|uniref:histidine kinase n=1 Tax=Rathayibacter oskolensis TaxID=1891671 RepID=A0A1X7MWD1_9MICO|nr:histidine kinase [Rathayibacter oskolensis]SMH28487.1 two-component system, NarL family, sensor histidine kinase DesK [Rathayibacter oskolensis]